MAAPRGARVRLINSIRVDPSKTGDYGEFERDVRRQLGSSTRKFDKLKTTVSHLVRFTADIRGVVDVDLLEKKAGRARPNMDVVRSLRLTKYILSTLVYFIRGDDRYTEDLKPGEAFFRKRPHLAETVKTGADVDTILLALYNEAPRGFVADTDPRYAVRALLREILTSRTRKGAVLDSRFFHVHTKQFEESILGLTGAVLRLLFNVEEADTDMDIMLYFVRSRGEKPVRMKRVFADDVKAVHQKIDHSLFLLNEAARYVLDETRKDASFIQQILSRSYVVNVLMGARAAVKSVDQLDALLSGMDRLKTSLRVCWAVRDRTGKATAELNAMMNGDVYRELLLLTRDMKESGTRFFACLQTVYGFYASLATRNGVSFGDVLDRLDGSMRARFSTINRYLRLVPGLERRLDTFRSNHGSLTMIEEGRSEIYRTIIHEVSQVYINFTTSTERGKLFHHHLKACEDFDLLYNPLYGDRIRSITDPIIRQQDSFPAQSRFNLGRYLDRQRPDPDAMRLSYRKIMRILLFSEAILSFYGNLQEDGRYLFDPAVVMEESTAARRHLRAILRYCRDYISAHEAGGAETAQAEG